MLRVRMMRVRAHAYATEDMEKVKKSLENIVGGMEPTVRFLEGYFGDRIAVLEHDLRDEARAGEILRKVVRAIGSANVGIEERSNSSGVIHARVDKQGACRGVIRHGRADAIKLEFTYEGDVGELEK